MVKQSTSNISLEIALSICPSDHNEDELCCPTEVTRVWSRLALLPTGKQSAAGRTLNPGSQPRRVPLTQLGRRGRGVLST